MTAPLSRPGTPGTLTLIAAVAHNGAIGKDNQLLWHLPEDMRYFRETTRGAPVIMGRKTWESLPERFRPLPGRRNIVISRQNAYVAPGAELAGSLGAARALTGDTAAFLIGGAMLYAEGIEQADQLLITEVDLSPEADAFFPPIDPSVWQETGRHPGISETGLGYAFVTYQRRP